MISPRFAYADPVPARPRRAQLAVSQSLEGQVSHALNLFVPLKTPAQMPALSTLLQASQTEINAALAQLRYVHFARFLPANDGSGLWVITTFDGELEPYIMDFVGVLGDVFTKVLYFVADAPRLPVAKYPRDFIDYVKSHNNARVDVWAAYPELTVIDIQTPPAGP